MGSTGAVGGSALRRSLLLALTMLLVSAGVLAAAPALAQPERAQGCTVNGTTVTVVADNGYLQIVRRGDDLEFNYVPCGTVTTVDRVDIDMAYSDDQQVQFLTSGGPFAPGYTDERNGSSEIEFFVTGADPGDDLGIAGWTGDDSFTVETRFQDGLVIHGVNLNAAEAPRDNDITFYESGPDGPTLKFSTSSGNDRITAAGTGTLGSSPASVNVEFYDDEGSDTMTGGWGNDTWRTFPRADPGDSFTGGFGVDTVDTTFGDGAVRISLDGTANDGHDCPGVGCEGDNVAADVERVRTGAGSDVLIGNGSANDLSPGGGNNIVQGLGGNDVLRGNGIRYAVSANAFLGGGGDDTFIAGFGDDLIFGGDGRDKVSYAGVPAPGPAGVSVSLDGEPNDGLSGEGDNVAADVEDVIGTAVDDVLLGSPAGNRLSGRGGNDTLTGGGGADILVPGAGVDTLLGGPALDTAEYTDAGAAITADLETGTATGDGDDRLTSMERLTGSPFGDDLSGNAGPNVLDGRAGDDTLTGRQGDDTLLGGLGSDTMFGGLGTDICTQGPGTGPQPVGCEGS